MVACRTKAPVSNEARNTVPCSSSLTPSVYPPAREGRRVEASSSRDAYGTRKVAAKGREKWRNEKPWTADFFSLPTPVYYPASPVPPTLHFFFPCLTFFPCIQLVAVRKGSCSKTLINELIQPFVSPPLSARQRSRFPPSVSRVKTTRRIRPSLSLPGPSHFDSGAQGTIDICPPRAAGR